MIEIDVNSVIPPDVSKQFDVESLRGVVLGIAEAARAEWIKLSMTALHKSQQEYTKGISAVVSEGDVAYVQLTGVFPNMIEQGFSPFDLRDTLLGPNVPVAAPGEKGKHESKGGGYYRAISFRMMGARSTGRNAQRTTDVYQGHVTEERAKKLGRLAEKRMKTLSPTQSNPGGATAWGESLQVPLGDKLDVLGRSHKLVKLGADAFEGDKPIFVPHGGPDHKSPMFQGAYRFEQHYKSKTQNSYGTFRTISTNVTDGWIHPGYQPGAHLAEKANDHAMRVAADIFKAMAGVGGTESK